MGFIVQFKWSIYKVMTQNVTSLNLKLPHWDSVGIMIVFATENYCIKENNANKRFFMLFET